MTVPVVALVPILVVLVLVAVDLWVYADAMAQEKRGTPVVFRIGLLTVDTPAAWAIGCLVLFVVFLPLYLAARNRDYAG